MNHRRKLLVALVVAALALACHEGQAKAKAKPKPFRIVGAGVATTGLPLPGEASRSHWSVGNATHLGLYAGEGTIQTDSAEFDPNIGSFGGFKGEFGSGSPYVFTAANGDELVCWYGRTDKGASEPGSFELTIVGALEDGSLVVEAQFIAEFIPQSDACTGKFAGVTGGWVMYAWSEPFILGSEDPTAYWWEGNGSLTFE